MATSFPKWIQFCVGEDLALVIVDLTFHGQWHILQVWCQPPCSSRFARFGSNPSAAHCIGFAFEVIVARCGNCQRSFKTRSLKQSRLQPSSKLILDAMESEAAKL